MSLENILSKQGFKAIDHLGISCTVGIIPAIEALEW